MHCEQLRKVDCYGLVYKSGRGYENIVKSAIGGNTLQKCQLSYTEWGNYDRYHCDLD